jgi:hypothetical protein
MCESLGTAEIVLMIKRSTAFAMKITSLEESRAFILKESLDIKGA